MWQYLYYVDVYNWYGLKDVGGIISNVAEKYWQSAPDDGPLKTETCRELHYTKK